MTKTLFFVLLFLAGAGETVAVAGVYPPTTRDLLIPSLVVRAETGAESDLTALFGKESGPVFLIPGYVACHGTCPLLARTMRSVLRDRAPHRVVFLSFAGDEASALSHFRQREKLPPHWRVVAARSQAEAKKFLDHYGYSFEQRRGEFVHPNQVLVLAPDGRWAASLFIRDGLDTAAVTRAFAMAHDQAPWDERLVAHLTDPRWLLTVGVLGFSAALSFVLVLFFRRWRRTQWA